MPELPEVETVKNGLKSLIGKKLLSFTIYKDGWRKPIPVNEVEGLKGQEVIDVYRRAKWPALVFKKGCLWMHLGMSGQLKLFNTNENVPQLHKHDHIEFLFSDGQVLRFQDARRFGLVAFTENAYSEPPSREKLGFEPFDEKWSTEQFYNDLKGKKKPIKIILMEGHLVVGVGNIYASESLFKAKISPLREGKDITFNEAKLLREEIIKILLRGIEAGGSTLKDHRTINGEMGSFQDQHLVYGKEGQRCKICDTEIIKIVQGGRSTFYCPECQK